MEINSGNPIIPGAGTFTRKNKSMVYKFIFHRQLDFPSEPGVANEILETEPKNCLAVA